ncbi:MAG: carboxypeptidase-like regulatory domain-containing protein [Bacteroidia bacterium]
MIPSFIRWGLLAALLALCVGASGQSLSGTLRGQITDRQSGQPLAGVQVELLTAPSLGSAKSDAEGFFRWDRVPVGRHDVQFLLGGYRPFLQTGVLVSTAKEAVVEVRMDIRLYEAAEVLLTPETPRGTPRNAMASVSALSFEIEETRKFAGGLDDPTRLAANFPGVIAAPFTSENFISVRGNSSRGLLYRVEGVDIPNPNHFARIGGSGGTFTIFSNQVLTNSDFFIGAFPAEYGNATAGVFDVQFRNGNNERREYAFQAGVLGFDFAAEGPFSANSKASYLINYRFATLNLAKYLINYTSVPTYSDLSFKLNFPTRKAGTFGVFGMGGLSNRLRGAEEDSSLWEGDLDRFELLLRSDIGVAGITHSYLLGGRSILKSALVGSYSVAQDNRRYFEDDATYRTREIREYTRQPITFTTSLQHHFSDRITTKTGLILTRTAHDYTAIDYDYVAGRDFTLADEAGQTFTAQAYAQAQLRATDRFTVNAGLHYLYFDLNGRQSVEPRLGLSYQLDPRQKLSFGYGLHSQVEHWATYMTRLEGSGDYSLPNLNLDFARSHHFVLGYQAMLNDHMHFRAETYYQRLYQVPVEITGTYSVLNIDELNQLRILTNGGTGRNYGLDLGLERFSRHGFYYMLNGSIFNSTYTDVEGVRHSTAYNTGYKANFLLGKEYRTGRRKGLNNLLGFNGTLSLIGGQRYTPLDIERSRLARETVLDERYPWTEQDQPLLIFDFSMNIHRNHPRYTGIWALQIKNMLQSAPAEYREWDALLDQPITLRGAGLLPVLSYKIQF